MTKGRSRRAAERKVYHATFGSLAWVRNCGGRLFAKRSCWRVVHRHVVKLPHTDAPTRNSRTRAVWIGARTRKDHVRLRRPAARKETGAQDRQANPDPPANGKAPRTWCVCQWPNEVHGSALRPGQGGVCPPPSLQGASTLQQQGGDASAHTNNGDDDDTGQDDGGRARELYRDGNARSAGKGEGTRRKAATWPSAVSVCLRPCGDDALSDAVQAAATRATATKAAAVAVPAMRPGAAMSRALGVTRSALAGVAMRRLQRAARRLAGAKSSRRQSRPFRTNRLPDPLRRTLARRRERGTYRTGARTTPP